MVSELAGRFQIVPGQPTLVLDVSHNPHSVAALAANLDVMGYFPTTHAVFGAMADKDLVPMLAKVNPIDRQVVFHGPAYGQSRLRPWSGRQMGRAKPTEGRRGNDPCRPVVGASIGHGCSRPR